MSSIVIEFLNTRFEKDADVKVGFLFCSYQSQHVQESDDLLSSILRQLAYRNSGKLCSHVEDLYKARLSTDWTALDHEKVTPALLRMARSYKKIFIVLDGLDEHLPSNPEERRQLLSELLKLQIDLPWQIGRAAPLIWAVERKCKRLVSMFLKLSTRIEIRDAPDRAALLTAVKDGDPEMIDLLLTSV